MNRESRMERYALGLSEFSHKRDYKGVGYIKRSEGYPEGVGFGRINTVEVGGFGGTPSVKCLSLDGLTTCLV